MRYFLVILAAVLTAGPLVAQNAPLVADPAADQFEFCRHLFNQAGAARDQQTRANGYRRLIPRLEKYLQSFPRHPNVQPVLYFLGESYYHSGSLDEGKRLLHTVVNRYREGRYVAMASNRLGYDAVANKKYAQAAIHFGRVATMSATVQERHRGRYQQASCYRYAKMTDQAVSTYTIIAKAKDAPVLYREHANLKLGHLYLDKKDKDKALEKFEAVMLPNVADDVRIEATLNAGIIYLEQKKNDLAEKCFKAVILSKEEKFKASAQVALMNVMYANKNYQGVLDTLKRGNHKGQAATDALKYSVAGRSAYKLKQYHEAIKLFAQAEQQVPLSAKAFEAAYFRMLCFFNIEGVNLPLQVDAFLEVYGQRFPKHEYIHKALMMQAETLFDQKKYREAAAAYNKIDLTKIGEENQVNLLYKRGWCLTESGDHNGAVRDFTRFLKRAPEDSRAPRVIARRGKSFLALSDRVSALKDFDLLIQRFPKDKLAALAWQNSARIRKQDQDYSDMIRRYEAMVTNFPDLQKETIANGYYWIGWGNYQIKKYPESIQALEKATKMEPEKYEYKASMLIVYGSYSMKDKKRLQEAVEKLRGMGKEVDIQQPIYRWLGVQCFNAGEMKLAERYLSLGTTPEEPRQTPMAFWKMLGKSRVETGKYKEALIAVGHYLDVVEQPFWKAESLLDQAVAHLGLESLDQAKQSAEAGLALRPKGKINAELRLILGDIAYNAKDFAAAAAHYVVVVQFAGDKELKPAALFKAYKALEKKGDAKEGNKYLQQLNEEFPDYLKNQETP
ncbi:MAG: tetratricopeptide repeat protein [Akkermansiaceae bacterium]